MESWAAGFATGIACGLGAGFAIGYASGRPKKAWSELTPSEKRSRIWMVVGLSATAVVGGVVFVAILIIRG